MSLRDTWTYDQGDPMLLLFTHAVTLWGFDIPPGSRVLELGCRETDWAQRIKKAVDCHVTGIDALPCPDYGGDAFVQGDASDASLLDALGWGSFDAVVSLGAIEHFGLGYYGDPVGPSKDREAVENAWEWLKPGGSLYFDVPWTPTVAHQTTHYRVYSDQSWREAFEHYGGPNSWHWRARGWAPNERERDDFTQVRPMAEHLPFYFYAAWGVKPL